MRGWWLLHMTVIQSEGLGWGLGAGASKASQKKRRNEEGPACASHPVDKMLPSTATCRLLYCIVGRCAAYMAPWH